ncbi:MAG: type II toxin-antitoxin system PemK/MazF family toxin [Caldilineaceae bacterium]|nr:type II toxin-antitoxin system PemK/MazF family toxin [Caldilineaceae bacterium]
MSISRGAVVLVPFPFTDLTRQKPRPAVVLSTDRFNNESDDIILVALSSNTGRPLLDYEFVIQSSDADFAETGLRVPSVVRCGKLVTMDQSLVIATLGKFNTARMNATLSYVRKALGLN